MTLNVCDVSENHLSHLKDVWLPFAEKNEYLPTSTYERGIRWINDLYEGNVDTQATPMAVIDSESNVLGVFDLIHVHPLSQGGYLKILNIVLQPQVDLALLENDQDSEDQEDWFSLTHKISEIVSTCFQYAISRLSKEAQVDRVKVYSSDKVTSKLLKDAFVNLPDDQLRSYGFESHAYGNWIELRQVKN